MHAYPTTMVGICLLNKTVSKVMKLFVRCTKENNHVFTWIHGWFRESLAEYLSFGLMSNIRLIKSWIRNKRMKTISEVFLYPTTKVV